MDHPSPAPLGEPRFSRPAAPNASQASRFHHLFLWIPDFTRNPERWLLVPAAAAWIVLATRPHSDPGLGGGPDWIGLGVMVIAMMLPMTLGSVGEMIRSHGSRVISGFLAGYLAAWMLAMAIIQQAWTFAASRVQWTHGIVAIAVAATLWEMAPAAWRRGSGCTEASPARTGLRGWLGAVRVGGTTGVGCVRACWALMAMCVAAAHDVRLMLILFAVQMTGRHLPATSSAWRAVAVVSAAVAFLATQSSRHPRHHSGEARCSAAAPSPGCIPSREPDRHHPPH